MRTPVLLVACEYSQIVTAAFRAIGIRAYSNDIIPTEGNHPEWHIIGDARQVVQGNGHFRLQTGEWLYMPGFFDMIIAHPPCTMITHSSSVALAQGKHSLDDVKEGAAFFLQMLNAPAYYVAIENPAPMKIAGLPQYNQIVQPYMFGHPYSKRICLWLKNLPPILPTGPWCNNYSSWIKHCSGTSKRRARFWEGVADAMAMQWGDILKRSVK